MVSLLSSVQVDLDLIRKEWLRSLVRINRNATAHPYRQSGVLTGKVRCLVN